MGFIFVTVLSHTNAQSVSQGTDQKSVLEEVVVTDKTVIFGSTKSKILVVDIPR